MPVFEVLAKTMIGKYIRKCFSFIIHNYAVAEQNYCEGDEMTRQKMISFMKMIFEFVI